MSGVSADELAAVLAALAGGAAPADAARQEQRASCAVCGEPLDAVLADVGTHPSCDPEPAGGEPPPSTVGELAGVLLDFDANSVRSRQVAIGPSQIAVSCDRRLAYSLAGSGARADGRVKWAPLMGTAVHALIADALVAENVRLGRERWLVEQRVHPDATISGSCDAYDVDTDTVIDWKLVGPTTIDTARRKGPGAQYEGQIHLYGRGWQRAGRHPKWVRIVFLPRSVDFDDAFEWTAPYSRRAADAALERMYAIGEQMERLDVANVPANWEQIAAAPGRMCGWCPYMRRGTPADDTGCPGDVAADERRIARFTDGLIAPAGGAS